MKNIGLAALPEKGILDKVVAELVGPLSKPKPARIAIVACGTRIHFPWDKACARYDQAHRVFSKAVGALPIEVIRAPEPYEDPEALCDYLDSELKSGLAGIVFFHAAYTAGEIGSCLGRWLIDRHVPLLSWAWPEQGTGGSNEANSLTCQNFLLQMWKQMGVPYAWIHEEIDEAANEVLAQFSRAAYARQGFRSAKLLHAGGSRVTGFYDGEVDELEVMKNLGCRFDRVDLETVYQHAKARFKDAEVLRLKKALESHPACSKVDLPEEQILKTYRLGLGILDLARKHGYVGATVKSWPDLFDCYGCAIDGAVSMMNDYGFCVAEEGEMNGLLSSLSLWLLSNGSAIPTMMDLSLWKQKEDRLGIWHCGASPTRLMKPGTQFAATRHSILENGDPDTAVGLMLEFLLRNGPITVMRYLAPDAAKWFAFEGEFVDTELDYRGSYGLMKATGEASLGQIMGTIFDAGLDHHWSVGYGHWLDELRMLNHFCGLSEISLRQGVANHGLSR
ncbi:fucose isomerase [Pelagicoccus sp. SDUM812003]|uniref:L-fucose/L-arabinose isomerase family protein n=1 Tax=Pelagicoccus sp. SDUM812003 TaxID=3041267 RepID=UPI00280CF249|nr:fucose isomerase [Pelagicoccus sp. SDUM812003]MDQ8201441.1 fucose isomerase [Pelagicoccus sp. SDUM812003]